jgi:RimJ/RimL family protein N-acetyltransferase
MTRAVKLCENLGFETMNLKRIEIRTDAENGASAAIPKRLGYVFEGTLRQAFALRNDSRDILVFSKLKSEWEKENKNA